MLYLECSFFDIFIFFTNFITDDSRLKKCATFRDCHEEQNGLIRLIYESVFYLAIGYNYIMNTFFIVIAIFLLVWVIWSLLMDQNLESPKYIVLEERNGYEIRKYDSYIIAETTVPGDSSSSTGQAFGELGGYIFGANTEKKNMAMTTPVSTEEKSKIIAMTAPVTTEKKGDMMTMSFMMPSEFTLDNMPIPNSNNVVFKEVPPGIFATYSFNGLATKKRRIHKTTELMMLLERDNVEVSSEPQLLQYDRPTKFPLLKTNDIKVKIGSYE
ncbi:MAG: hypothetical protein ACI88L_000369 [Candidatus Paceibacteria bacterium]